MTSLPHEAAIAPDKQMRKPRTLMQRAVAALARREYSRAELRSKLLPYVGRDEAAEALDGALDQVLEQLSAKGMLSDQRFAASRVRLRAQRYGAERIRRELRQFGLSDEVTREAMATLQGSELDRARDMWQRKFGVPPADAAQRARQMRFLSARGFAVEIIVQVMKTVPNR